MFYLLSKSTVTNKELLFQSLDHSRAGILITDPQLDDNPIIYANRGFYDMTGYPANEILGQNCRFLQGDQTDMQEVHNLKKAIESNQSKSVTLLNYKKNGEVFWNSLTVDHLFIEDEQKHYFIGVQKDVTDQKLLETSYEESLQEISNLGCPIVPLLQGIAVLPLIGSMNDKRFVNILLVTTNEIVKKRLETVIVDLSGLSTVNDFLLSDLVRLRDVIKLQGASLIITGMSSNMAINALQSKEILQNNLKSASSVQDVLEKLITEKKTESK